MWMTLLSEAFFTFPVTSLLLLCTLHSSHSTVYRRVHASSHIYGFAHSFLEIEHFPPKNQPTLSTDQKEQRMQGSSIVTKSLSFSSLFSNTSFCYYFEEWEMPEWEHHSVSIVKRAEHPLCSGCWEYSRESPVSEPAASREDKAGPRIPRTPGTKL